MCPKQTLGVKAPPVRIDSQAKYGAMARGDAAIYLRFPHAGYREKIWDHAAGSIVITGQPVACLVLLLSSLTMERVVHHGEQAQQLARHVLTFCER